jgi:hypothetical protein
MVKQALIIIFIIIFLYYAYNSIVFGPYNTTEVAPCSNCEKYQVHRAHTDIKAAAQLLKDINTRNETLISYLEKKYSNAQPMANLDPTKNNRIDVIPGTEMYSDSIIKSFRNPLNHEYIQQRIEQLINNYDPSTTHEISPLNKSGITSYTEDKHILVLCLRHKEPLPNGEHELHDINTMMFVVLHELTHMTNPEWNHTINFWILFKFLLANAVEVGVYTPVNYEIYPINYCGLWLRYNPLYDIKL